MRSVSARICLCATAAAAAACVSSNGVAVAAFSVETTTSRRAMLEQVTGASAAILLGVSTATLPPSPAQASGGATAGGAYLLSAKQRYNSRVTAGVKAFLALSGSLEGGSIDATKAFLTSEEEGGWQDLKSAGYLLSNAFRRNSTTAPDSLPSVKAWKAFAAEVEKMQKAADKKSKSGVADAYKKAEALLDDYLEKVELPPSIEISRS